MPVSHCDFSAVVSHCIEKEKDTQFVPMSAYDFMCGTFRVYNIFSRSPDVLSSYACPCIRFINQGGLPLFTTQKETIPKDFALWEIYRHLSILSCMSLTIAEKKAMQPFLSQFGMPFSIK